MKHFYYTFLLALLTCQCRPKEEHTLTAFPGKPEVPSSVKKVHDYLLQNIQKITLFHDSTGLAAEKLHELMEHHFTMEEDYVLPPLGLLPLLTNENLPEQSKEVIKLCDELKSQLSHLSVEHQLIKAYMDELLQAADKENHPEIIELEQELQKHAKIEEEVLFPAAILIGEYLKLKSK